MKNIQYITYTHGIFDLLNLEYPIVESKNIIHLQDTPTEDILQCARKNIAIIDWWQYNSSDLNLNLSWADLVVCMSAETALDNRKIYDSKSKRILNNNNIIYCVGGEPLNFGEHGGKLYSTFLYHFMGTVRANNEIIYDSNNRNFLFEALLGTKKYFRIKIFNFLKRENLLNKSLVSLFNGPWHQKCNLSAETYYTKELDEYDLDSYLEFKKLKNDDKHSSQGLQIKYKQNVININLSYIIAPKIYQNSWYSIVAESNFNSVHFFTEKTAKALIGKRIFILFAAPKSLAKLQELGFKTFNGIIDESYDHEFNDDKRMEKALHQIKMLSISDPISLYNNSREILEHNYNHIMNSDLGASSIRNFIQKHVDML